MTAKPFDELRADSKRHQSIKEIAKQFPDSIIGKAYILAQKAHAGQKRKSGEPYVNHAIATAETLRAWQLDEPTIAAGLLHDVTEDTDISLEEIKKQFGDEIAFIVDGVTKLGRIKYRGAEGKVENLRKMILALSQDLRVIFVKLADRLHNMRTLGALPPAKQKRVALETSEIYAPIAYRLGMHEIAGELQDLAFPRLHPSEDRWIKTHVTDEYEARRKYLENIKPLLEAILGAGDIPPITIDFRAKRHYSLYQKLIRHDMDLGRIYDLIALRVILPKIEDCYAALGTIHHAWPPLPGRIKDYIAMPKANNYRSLHTTVIGPEGKYIEIQLRTQEMHEENEYGIAAHWLYKDAPQEMKKQGWTKKVADSLTWITQLKHWQEKYRGKETDPEDFLRSMKVEFFKDRIFAITPKGDAIDLPLGSTPIDFAYHIHTNVGDTCVGTRINNQFAPLDCALKSGDLVEIITQKNKRPSEDWLRFVKTALARDHIKAALKAKKRALEPQRSQTKTELRVVAENRIGLIKDISGIIARSHVNIVSFETNVSPGSRFAINRIECAMINKEKIEKIVLKLKKLREVKEIGYKIL